MTNAVIYVSLPSKTHELLSFHNPCHRLFIFSDYILHQDRNDYQGGNQNRYAAVRSKGHHLCNGCDRLGFLCLPGLSFSRASTYTNTVEGIKFFAQSPRSGVRLQVKNEVGFKDKTLLYKWKATGGGLFTDLVLSVKYVPTTGNGDPAIQGVDLEEYSIV
jgi:hypothetical protein